MADEPTETDATQSLPPVTETKHVPRMIGPYRILARIGEGGFGVVYEAEQTEPVRRRVALKVIKPGMDSEAVVARFEAERQALAVMDHPCIAKVLDAGVTGPEQGSRPYFVMELVRGEPITCFCDIHTLGVHERVRLFVRVCEAVQHAHTKGVVHRDLKPSNVLVAYDGDGRAQPKVIDFGVAKALNQRLTEKTIFTDRGQLIGTPEYMSPEQAEMSGLDIDTRADVYSLGVLLYELLTGTLPFDPASLRRAAFVEIQRIIREVDPPKPSTRLRTLLASEPDERTGMRITRARHTDARTLAGMLQRDLDWVVMKCLEKPRERRYDTCSALAADLQRFLNNEPLDAGPPDLSYRLSKALRRHRGAAVAIGTCALLLILGIAGTTFGLVRAQRAAEVAEREATAARRAEIEQRRLAESEARARVAADAAAEKARQSLKSAQSVNSMFGQLLIKATPTGGSERDTAVFRRLVNTASEYIKSETLVFEVASELRLTVIAVLLRMGQTEEANAHYAQLLTDLTAHEASPRTLLWYEMQIARNRFYSDNPRDHLEEYEAFVGDVAAELPLSDPLRAQAFLSLARLQGQAGEYQAALAAANQALNATDEVKQTLPIDIYLASVTSAFAEGHLGNVDAAIDKLEAAYAWHQEHFGQRDSEAGAALGALREMYLLRQDVDGVESTMRRHLKNVELVFGYYSDYAISTLTYYADAFDALGRTDRSAALLQEAVARASARFGPHHPGTLDVLRKRAEQAMAAGKSGEAIKWLAVLESDDDWQLIYEPQVIAQAIGTFARACQIEGQVERAMIVVNRAASQLQAVGSADRAAAGLTIAWTMYELGAFDDSMHVCEVAMSGASKADTANLLRCMARSAERAGRFDDAEALYARAVATADSTESQIWDYGAILSDAGWFYHRHTDNKLRARDLLERACEVLVRAGEPYSRDAAGALVGLAQLLREQGDFDAAELELNRAFSLSDDKLVCAQAALERACLVAAKEGEASSLQAFHDAKTKLVAFPTERWRLVDATWGEANALSADGRIEDAIGVGLEAMRLRESLVGSADGYHLHMMQRVSEWTESIDPAQSEKLLIRKVEICRDAFGDGSPEYHDACFQLALFYERAHKLAEAFERAKSLTASLQASDGSPLRIGEASLVAGRIAFHLSRWEDAERLLRIADEAFVQSGAEHWDRRKESLYFLVALFEQRSDVANEEERAAQLRVFREQRAELNRRGNGE